MSDMKCPFCQDTLIPCIKNQNDWIYHCDNQKCPMYDDADNENAKHLLASKDLWQELIRTKELLEIESSEHELCHDAMVKRTEEVNQIRKELKQSETCCTEWEKQALDYKAENIALSGDLERTRKALDKAKWWLKEIVENHRYTPISTAEMALKEITALEQKDVK